MQLPDGHTVWMTSTRSYVKNTMQVIEQLFEEDAKGYFLKNKVKNPFPSGYQLELDESDELGPELASQFMHLIGILQWAVKLGHIDIYLKVSLLSQYQVNPRLGHLEVAYHIYAWLKRHPDMGCIAYGPKDPIVDELVFNNNADWMDFYGEVKEELPSNMPEP